MSVGRIINEKGRDVATVGANASLGEVAATLSERKIGAVLVMDGESIRGILSERDIVKAVARHGAAALDLTSAEAMTAKVVTCGPNDTINDLMEKMTRGRFRHVPVVENGRLVGIVSIGDVVKRRIEEVEREAHQIREYIATA